MPNLALLEALALASAPTLARVMRERPLPEGIEDLLAVFARREEATAALLDGCGLDRRTFTDCVDNYIQKIVLHPGGDPYRMLAGAPTSSREELRRHMKLLMEGLHPDKAGGAWKSAYAPRVIEAWRAVSTGRAVAPPPRAVLRRRRRLLPWIPHPVKHRGRRMPWRLALVLAAGGGVIASQWRSVQSSLLALAGSFAP